MYNTVVFIAPLFRLLYSELQRFSLCIGTHDPSQHVVDSVSDASDKPLRQISDIALSEAGGSMLAISVWQKRNTYTSLCHYEPVALDTATF